MQLIRYCIIGVGNTALDFALYAGLTRGWEFWRMHYLWANLISFTIVVTWSFFLNKHWTFRERSLSHGVQYIKFVAVTLGGVVITQGILFTGIEIFSLHDLLAKVIAAPLVVLWNFSMHRLWTFRAV